MYHSKSKAGGLLLLQVDKVTANYTAMIKEMLSIVATLKEF
jgi:hypothetical protein